MKLARITALLLFLSAFLFAAGDYSLGQQSPPGSPSFKDVAPIFQTYCIQCHAGPKPPLGLRLDNYENVMKGSDEPVIVPGEPKKSSLFLRIIGEEKPRMPRNGPPWLNEKETVLIKKWIAEGALP